MKKHGPIIQSQALVDLHVIHGFTTRQAGASKGPYSSFNLSDKVGDDLALVEANRRTWEQLTGLRWKDVVQLSQVHGADVLVVDGQAGSLPPMNLRKFDAAISFRAGSVLAISTADCVPILLYCRSPKVVGAAHAGWRGTMAGIASNTVEAMCNHAACQASDIVAVIGPCIHFEAFEVGPDVFEMFEKAFGQSAVGLRRGKAYVDLVESNKLCLMRSGLPEESIHIVDHCTFSDEELFFSHRRDKGRTGRQMSFICLA